VKNNLVFKNAGCVVPKGMIMQLKTANATHQVVNAPILGQVNEYVSVNMQVTDLCSKGTPI
jgi:DNA/RNA endonuclease YhcR with UshA esterase domain